MLTWNTMRWFNLSDVFKSIFFTIDDKINGRILIVAYVFMTGIKTETLEEKI
jgi:hypothetical protein